MDGDSILVFRVADDIKELKEHVAACRQRNLRNVRAVARDIVTISFPALLVAAIASDLKVEELVQETLKLVEPCFAFFEEK